jgi:single-strand DNA-binding protein
MARVEVKGNVGTDAEIKFFKGANGDFAVTSFSLAETLSEKKGNEWVDGETVWYRISVSGKDAESATEIKKGDKVIVIGKLKVSTYQAKDGTTKVGIEIKAESWGVKPKAKYAQPKPQAEADSFWNS